MALRVLTQKWGPDRREVARFSKQLDLVTRGWPGAWELWQLLLSWSAGLQADPGPANHYWLLTKDALAVKGHHWLTGGKLSTYQALLLVSPDLTLTVCQTLNPAVLLSLPEGELSHKYVEIIEQVHSCRSDLQGGPLSRWRMVYRWKSLHGSGCQREGML